MNLQEIKQAIAEGKSVHWKHKGYTVFVDELGKYLICCAISKVCINLIDEEGSLRDLGSDFFIGDTNE
jgi:hypothetical protein